MPRIICHHKGLFWGWSTVSDMPTSRAMTKEQFEAWYRDEYGRQGMDGLPARLGRAVQNGSSSLDGESALDLLRINQMGPRGGQMAPKKALAAILATAVDASD